MVDRGNKQGPQDNKQQSKMVKKTKEDAQYKEQEKKTFSLKQVPNCFLNGVDEKNAKIMENNFPNPGRVTVIST